MIDQKTGLCKGYGFAMYEKEEDCEKAINELNKKGLQASFARVGQVGSSPPQLFTKSLSLFTRHHLGIIQLPTQEFARRRFNQHLCLKSPIGYD